MGWWLQVFDGKIVFGWVVVQVERIVGGVQVIVFGKMVGFVWYVDVSRQIVVGVVFMSYYVVQVGVVDCWIGIVFCVYLVYVCIVVGQDVVDGLVQCYLIKDRGGVGQQVVELYIWKMSVDDFQFVMVFGWRFWFGIKGVLMS